MDLDYEKIDHAVLALLMLGSHQDSKYEPLRAWKSFDWDSMDRLFEKGYISDPKSKAKSVGFTDEGLQQAQKLLEELFGA